jgi:hypothetical protein
MNHEAGILPDLSIEREGHFININVTRLISKAWAGEPPDGRLAWLTGR